MSFFVVVEGGATRWKGQVWEHDGDEPVALFHSVEHAHLFVAILTLIKRMKPGNNNGTGA